MNKKLSKPYPHYCAVHNLYYGSPTDTIPATICPLCGIKAELLAQPAPRTYEVARALSWCDAVENSIPVAPQGWQQGAAELVKKWRKESSDIEPVGTDGSPEGRNTEVSMALYICAEELEKVLKHE